MNLHQVLTGAANEGDHCLSVGSVDGSHFTAYAAGSNIVVLDGNFNRVQVISGSGHGLKSEVSCIVCCRELGKIAASCEGKLYIFEPVPVIYTEHKQAFKYQWSESCVLMLEANIVIMAWNYYGSRLITSLSNGVLQMWEEPDPQQESCDQHKTNDKMPEFFIGDSDATENKEADSISDDWVCVWSCKLPNPVVKLKFSTDGLFFATAARNDKLVKIWYENLKASSGSLASSLSFSSIFIAHPKPVTGFTWRRSSKYIYKGCIANMLLTTCEDAICRIWSETFLPDDPMTDVTYKGSTSSVEQKASFFGHFRNRHRYHKENDRGNKHRFLHRLTHIKKILNTKKKSGTKISLNSLQTQSSSSHHINDSFNHILADVHFHLAASIDFNSDIPMPDTFENGAWPTTFVSHWLNNKEFQTNSSVERILSCMTADPCLQKTTQDSPLAASPSAPPLTSPQASISPTSLSPELSPTTQPSEKSINVTKIPKNRTDMDITSYASNAINTPSPQDNEDQHKSKDYDSHMDQLIHQWNEASDVLFSIHPADGSLLIWTIHYLDEAGPGIYRQPQVSFNSRLPKAFPAYDAATMHTAPRLYYESTRGQQQINVLRALNAENPSQNTDVKMDQGSPEVSTPRVLLLSKHINGSLNLWNMSFSSTCNFSHAISVTHLRRICGHRFHAVASTCHPTLPLLLSTSHFDHEGDSGGFSHSKGHCTELILWKVMPIGPLSKSGGIMELARVHSPICSAFLHVAWLPKLLPISSLTNKSWTSPSSLFIASNGLSLKVYQAVFDARCILSDLKTYVTKDSADSPMLKRRQSISAPAYNVISHQSTEKPGCIIDLMPLNDAQKSWNNIQLMHVFQEKIVTGASTSTAHKQIFYLVILQKLCGSSKMPDDTVYGTGVHAWKLTVSYKVDSDSYQGINLTVSSSKICYHLLPLPPRVSVQSATAAVAHLSSSSIYPACRAPYLISTACSDSQVYFWRCKLEGEKMVWLQWEPLASSSHSRITVSGELLCVSCAYSGRIALLYKCPKAQQVPHIKENRGEEEEEGVNEQKMRFKEMFSGLKVVIYQCESTGGSEWQVEDSISLHCIPLPNILFAIHPSLSHHHPPKYLRHISPESRNSGHRVSAHFQIHSATANYHHEPIRASIPSSASLHNLTKQISTHTHLPPNFTKPIVFLDWVSAENGSHVLTVGVGSRILLYVPTNNNALGTLGKQTEGSNEAVKRGKLQKSMTLALPNIKPQRTEWVQVRCIELQTHDGMAPFPKHLSWVRNGILVVGLDNEMQIYSQWPDFNNAIAADCVVGEDGGGVKKEETKDVTTPQALKESHLLPRNQSVVLSLSKSLSSAWLIDSAFTNQNKAEEIVTEDVKSKAGKLSTGVIDHEDFNKVGLFEAARLASPCIPQFHPKLLLELLNFGKVKRVKVILWHLLRCIVGNQQNTSRTTINSAVNITTPSDTGLWSTGGGVVNDVEDNSSGTSEDEALKIESIPPLPLYALLAADDAVTNDVTDANAKVKGSRTNDDQYDELFTVDNALTSKDDPFIDLDPDASAAKEQQQQQAKITNLGPPGTFGPSQASILSKHLTRVSLPGLSSLDQMYLLALAETVASTRLEFAEQSRVSGHENVNASGNKNGANQGNDLNTNVSDHSVVDNCGLRFLLASRHFTYLLNTLPLRQRAQLLKKGLSSSEFIWAFHSDSQQELLDSLPCMNKGTPTWNELKLFGVGWWLRNIDSLTRLIEKVAKTAFQANKDPLDSALFYLAMKKKNILWGLFRSVNDSRMAQFFKNDFNEDRWRKAALKNAFKLIGLQKFQCAAAFFLLGGAVKDAVEVCLKNINDIQLAMVVLRLYEGQVDSGNELTCKKLLKMKVLGEGKEEENVRSYDPFLRSMASWVLNDYVASLETLLEEDDGDEVEDVSAFTRQSSFKIKTPRLNKGLGYSGSNLGGAAELTSNVDDSHKLTARSSVFNFYVFLRTHPLIIRQQKSNHPNRQVNQSDSINSVERRLFYMTAHEHFLNGCPILALEVLLKLNPLMEEKEEEEDGWKEKLPNGDDTSSKTETADMLMKAEDFDWSQPLSLPDEPKLDITPLSSPASSPSSSPYASNQALSDLRNKEGGSKKNSVSEDMMAQQLKFVACLRMITDELATLATGFGLDGGQLRFHLYYWLEKEVSVLKKVCNYYLEEVATEQEVEEEAVLVSKEELRDDLEVGKDTTKRQSIEIPTSVVEDTPKNSPKLHEVLEAESKSYDAKNRRLQRRYTWLRANQNLLVTLLGCAVLHGSRDTGFASIRTELLLLLQELQQDPTLAYTGAKKVTPLHTPLPLLNTTFLTSTSLHANLIQHLNNMKYDVLMTLISMQAPPTSHNYTPEKILNLFNVGLALSSCMHQSLSDNDSFSVSDSSLLNLLSNKGYKASHLMAGIALDDIYEAPTSEPLQWPGISSFCTLMQKRHETHQLHILLLETFISVLLALLTYALAYYDSHLLYHLVAKKLTNECWGVVFGGAVRSLMKVTTGASEENACKHRVKLTTSAVGTQILQQRYNINRSSYKEKFVRPKMSVFDFFLSKPSTDTMTTAHQTAYTYPEDNEDDDDEESDDDDYDGDTFNVSAPKKKKENKTDTTHLNADSLAWKLIRYACVRCINLNINSFLTNIGFDTEELAHNSALLSEATRNLLTWEAELKKEVDASDEKFNISGLFIDTNDDCANKYHSLLHPNNSPFRSSHKAVRPVKRLWFCLAGNPQITDIFIRHVFASQASNPTTDGKMKMEEEAMKIIHKDQEIISAFAINQMNLNCIAMATNKEIIEMDMNNILHTPEWLQHDLDYDIEFIKNKMPQYDKPEDFLLLKTPFDHRLMNGALVPNNQDKASKQHNASTIIKGISIPGISNPRIFSYIVDRSRRAMKRIIKRSESGVKKLHSHPMLPFYVSGSMDGCVKLWEWGHHKPVSQVRKAGAFPKVTKVLFSNHGNKIGITDGEGNLSLWQVGTGSNINKPYFNIKCNNKTTYDMAFLSSSSLMCTAGHSTDQRNISIWDSLMPSKKMLVQSFLCHTDGCPVVVYAPNHQSLISGGKKGEICIFDIRQRQLRQTIQAHNSSLKTICLHPSLDVFLSGAADGDIKIWSLSTNQLLSTLPAEHCKPASALFRNVSSGVLQMLVSQQGHLFSCGNDGTMKIRKLYDVINKNNVTTQHEDDVMKGRKTSIFSASSLSNRSSRINSLSIF